ncbi:MAG: lipoate--protein ligase family protein [Planctomycetaceae bacterium]
MIDPSCRILIDEQPGSGSWNMAVDETLLESALESGMITVRIYRWSEPTVSLGYFQPSVADDFRFGDVELPAVRRLSGGGAIIHHHELTYSLALPPGHRLSSDPTQVYDVVHARLIEWLNDHGISASMRGENMGGSQPDRETFLCFSRGDRRDVLVKGRKILGSAQRRRRGAVLQHGSLILDRSPFAPEIEGVAEIAGIESNSLSEGEMGRAIASAMGIENLTFSTLAETEKTRVEILQRERYRFLDWPSRSRFEAASESFTSRQQ